ncbi:DUF2141 domain-containing protein [Sphingomonas bacterium]|uniref:DUF2141 domain-containing protein n=1 Tax=Sphingomonas bacterium TaxID=1895847 RepID=UPI0020C5B651|nr:DUF2141 domain-containing protein [Sphingomonas bacterium]
MTFAPLMSLMSLMPIAAAAPMPAVPVTASDGVLTVEVANVRAARGHVRIDICPQARFLKAGCPFSGNAPAVVGTTTVTVRDLPPGRYAVQAYLDENDNKDVDRTFFGLPKEGVGFSNDPRIILSPPKFADAAFTFTGAAQTIRLKLRYFL